MFRKYAYGWITLGFFLGSLLLHGCTHVGELETSLARTKDHQNLFVGEAVVVCAKQGKRPGGPPGPPNRTRHRSTVDAWDSAR